MELVVVDASDQLPLSNGVLVDTEEARLRFAFLRDEHLVAAVNRTEPHQFTVLLNLSREPHLKEINLFDEPSDLLHRLQLREVHARMFFFQRLQLFDHVEERSALQIETRLHAHQRRQGEQRVLRTPVHNVDHDQVQLARI